MKTSANALRISIRGFFGYCESAEFISRNPARLVRRAVCGAPLPRGLTSDEQHKLVTALDAADGPAPERDRALFRFMLATGARLGSTLALDVPDLDLDACEATLKSFKGDRVERLILFPTGDDRKGLRHIGIDELSYRCHHEYITVVVDYERGQVVWSCSASRGHFGNPIAVDAIYYELPRGYAGQNVYAVLVRRIATEL